MKNISVLVDNLIKNAGQGARSLRVQGSALAGVGRAHGFNHGGNKWKI